MDGAEVAMADAPGAAAVVDQERITGWLTSPVGGLDRTSVRRLRRVLRAEAGARTGVTSGELLEQAVLDPAHPWERRGAETGALRRIATALHAGVAAARRTPDGRGWALGVDAETVLWAVWDGLGLASGWQRQALAGGVAGRRATGSSTPCWDCSRPPSSSCSGAPGRGPTSSWTGCGPPRWRATRSSWGGSGTPSRCSPRRRPPGTSGRWCPSSACRRGCGPTCGCAARWWAPRVWWTSWRAARPPWPTSSRACGTTRPGSSSWPAPAPPAACW
ncbi:hypothetical protein BJF82_03015 [Kytococcus sp. CUA-901]|nr:hypothetical protein BJF82_03015 [Kytococcus sp. CUA-901]